MDIRSIVLINGPAGSGKDTLAEMLEKRNGYFHRKFAAELSEATRGLFGINPDTWRTMRTARDLKDAPSELLVGMTPREAMIWVSEEVIKPKLGADYFGHRLWDAMNDDEVTWSARNLDLAISDSGFSEEAQVLQENAGADKVLVVHLTRPGCSFAGDSRGYIALEGSQSVAVDNSRSPEYLYHAAMEMIHAWNKRRELEAEGE